MTNTLQQIKDDVAQGSEFIRFPAFYDHTTIPECMIDQIAIRYAQEQKRELVEMLEQAKEKLYGCQDPATSTTMLAREIEELITKHKQS